MLIKVDDYGAKNYNINESKKKLIIIYEGVSTRTSLRVIIMKARLLEH